MLAPGQARDVGDLRQGQRRDRQHLVGQRAAAPAAHRQPAQIDPEQQGQQRRHDEVGNRDAGHGGGHDRVVEAAVLLERGESAEPGADDHRQEHRRKAELQGHRQAGGDQLAHREVLDLDRGPEVALQDAEEVVGELPVERLVQVVLGQNVGFDLRRQGPVLVEGAAGRRAHHEEGDANDHQEGRDRSQNASDRIGQHVIGLREKGRRPSRLGKAPRGKPRVNG
jgi:hypothetical protein